MRREPARSRSKHSSPTTCARIPRRKQRLQPRQQGSAERQSSVLLFTSTIVFIIPHSFLSCGCSEPPASEVSSFKTTFNYHISSSKLPHFPSAVSASDKCNSISLVFCHWRLEISCQSVSLHVVLAGIALFLCVPYPSLR